MQMQAISPGPGQRAPLQPLAHFRLLLELCDAGLCKAEVTHWDLISVPTT